MRSFFAEGDMVVVWRGGGVQVMICPRYMFDRGDLQAEVQQFFGDGALSMHTRSLKYGKVCAV